MEPNLARRIGACVLVVAAAFAASLVHVGPLSGAGVRAQTNVRPVAPNAAAVPGTPAYEAAQLRNEITTLKDALERLRQQMADGQQRTSASIAALSTSVGTLRRPVCVDDRTLRDPVRGISEDCSPFQCEPVSGTCREVCRSTRDCAAGYVCSTGSAGGGHCTRP